MEVKSEFCLGAGTFNCLPTASNYGSMTQQLTYNAAASTVTTLNTICTPGAGGCVGGHGSDVLIWTDSSAQAEL